MFPVNVGNHFCPVCSLRFESALVRDVHEQMVHRNPEKLRIVETKAGRVDYWKCPVCMNIESFQSTQDYELNMGLHLLNSKLFSP